MSLLNGVLACLSALSASCTWQAYVLALPSCFMCWRTWRALYVRWCSSQAHVLYELGLFTCLTSFIKRRPWHVSKNGVLGVLHKMVCLAYLGCFIKWRSWRALKNGVHGVLHKMTCLNLPNCFLGVFDHRVIVNYKFWMPSDVFNGTQESAKPIFTIFVFVLNLEFLVWVWIFIHIYKNQKQISWLSSINLKFSLPVSSNKVKKFLQREESFDSFIKLYDQIEQIFNTAVKFMWKPNSDGNYLCY